MIGSEVGSSIDALEHRFVGSSDDVFPSKVEMMLTTVLFDPPDSLLSGMSSGSGDPKLGVKELLDEEDLAGDCLRIPLPDEADACIFVLVASSAKLSLIVGRL